MILNCLLALKRPKSNVLATAVAFHHLKQGHPSFVEYIDKVTILFDQCKYPPETSEKAEGSHYPTISKTGAKCNNALEMSTARANAKLRI